MAGSGSQHPSARRMDELLVEWLEGKPPEPPTEVDRPGRVLIADDDETFRATLREALNSVGIEAIEAGTGDEARTRVDDWDPQVVVLDWLMPAAGLGLAQELISDHRLGGRVIMLTDRDDPRDRHSALQVGVALVFVKPPDLPSLIEAIQQALA